MTSLDHPAGGSGSREGRFDTPELRGDRTMAGKLAGKVAVITGGTSGIGLATAQRFVREGAFVFITGRRQEELDKAAREIGPNAYPIQGDVSKLADLDRLYATVEREKGKVDIPLRQRGFGFVRPPWVDHRGAFRRDLSTSMSAGSSSPCRSRSRCSATAAPSS